MTMQNLEIQNANQFNLKNTKNVPNNHNHDGFVVQRELTVKSTEQDKKVKQPI